MFKTLFRPTPAVIPLSKGHNVKIDELSGDAYTITINALHRQASILEDEVEREARAERHHSYLSGHFYAQFEQERDLASAADVKAAELARRASALRDTIRDMVA